MNINPVVIALWALGIIGILAFMESFMRRAGDKYRKYEQKLQEREESRRWEKQEDPVQLPKPELAPIPEMHTASYYWRSIVSKGSLGLLVVPVALVFLVINAKLLGEAFEVVLDRVGIVLLTVPIFGQPIEITDLVLYGLALSIAQVILGAELAERFKEPTPMRWLILFGSVVPLLMLEVFVSAWRGYTFDGFALAVTNGLFAWVAASIELICGYRGVHLLLLPLLQMVLWAIVTPFRALGRWLRRLKLERQQRPVVVKPVDAPSFATKTLAHVDAAVFDPLRLVENTLSQRLGKIFKIGMVVLGLVFGGLGLQPAHAMRWDVNFCYDTTTSVRSTEFAQYPKIARSALLDFLQPGDRLSILNVDGSDAQPIELESRLSKFAKQLLEIDQKLKDTRQNSPSAVGGSNFGLVLNHTATRIELNRQLAKSGKPTINVLVCLTDGEPDGKQTIKSRSRTVSEDYRLLFIGIRDGSEQFLSKSVADAGFSDQAKLALIPFQNSQEFDYSSFLGRSRNPALGRELARAQSKRK